MKSDRKLFMVLFILVFVFSILGGTVKASSTQDHLWGPPIITSPDLGGPYLVGLTQEFQIKIKNPLGGSTYTLLRASFGIAQITTAGLELFEAENPQSPGEWYALPFADDGQGGIVVNTPDLDASYFPPLGITYTLKFRVRFAQSGSFPATVSLYNAGNTPPTLLSSLQATMVVKAAPVLHSVDVSAPYLPGLERYFRLQLTNPAGGVALTKPFVKLVLADSGGVALDGSELSAAFVKIPDGGENWQAIPFVATGGSLSASLGPWSSWQLGLGAEQSLTFRFVYAKQGSYTLSFFLQDTVSRPGSVLASLVSPLAVVQAPSISSADLSGFYPIMESREFNLRLSNPATGADYSQVVGLLCFEGLVPADIASLEVSTEEGWQAVLLSAQGSCLQAGPIAWGDSTLGAGSEELLKLRVKFAHEGTVAVRVSALDATADPDYPLATHNGSMRVRDGSDFPIYLPFIVR